MQLKLPLMRAKERVRSSPRKSKETRYSDVPRNEIIEGDCLEILQHLPAASVDMILCDLPYGTTQNRWDSVIPLDKLWAEYRRVISNNGVIALTAQGAFTAKLINAAEDLFRYKIVWVKSKPTNFLNARRQPLRRHEDICIFYKRPPRYYPQMEPGLPYSKGVRKDQTTGSYGDFRPVLVESGGSRFPTDVVYFKTAESEGPVWHPTQKPVALARYLIRTFTAPGALVLDNACGSGSFLVAALLEGRDFLGIELNQSSHTYKHKDANYVEIARERIALAKCAIPLKDAQL